MNNNKHKWLHSFFFIVLIGTLYLMWLTFWHLLVFQSVQPIRKAKTVRLTSISLLRLVNQQEHQRKDVNSLLRCNFFDFKQNILKDVDQTANENCRSKLRLLSVQLILFFWQVLLWRVWLCVNYFFFFHVSLVPAVLIQRSWKWRTEKQRHVTSHKRIKCITL